MIGSDTELCPDLSVVIPTRNRPHLLAQVVAALAVQQGVDPGRLEVVVVDDGSLEPAATALSSLTLSFPLRVLRQPHFGVAKARNAGWAAARGEVILFLDDDVTPGPNLVAAHISAHAISPVVVVLGAVSSDPAQIREPWNAYQDAVRDRKYQALATREIPSGIHYGGNFSVRRRHLESAGGFDHTLALNQDVDLGFRFRLMGLKFVFEPAATGVHRGGCDLHTWKLMHLLRGRFDVAMFSDRGYAGGLKSIVACYHDRHILNRLLVSLTLTNRTLERHMLDAGIACGLRAHRLGFSRLSHAAFSAAANLLYWTGVRDGVRGSGRLRQLLRRTRRHVGRPYALGIWSD